MLRRTSDDLRYSLKVLRRNKLVYAILFLMASIGIGLNVTTFTFLKSIVIETFPFPELDRVVAIGHQTAATQSMSGASKANYLDIVRYSKEAFEDIGLIDEEYVHARGSDAQSRYQEYRAEYITQSVFNIAGVKMAQGRPFVPEEMAVGGRNVVIISHRLWRTFFNGSENIIGEHLWINEEAYRILGVVDRESFLILNTVDLFLPMRMASASSNGYDGSRDKIEANIIARLRDGVSPEQAQLDLDRVGAAILAENPQHKTHWEKVKLRLRLQPFRAWMMSGGMSSVQPSIYLMLVLSAVVLGLIIANALILSYGVNAKRRREFAIRWCIGAKEQDIRRQLIMESCLLFLAAGVLSIIIAKYMLAWIIAQIPEPLPVGSPIEMSTGIVLGTVAISTLLGAIFGYLSTLSIDFGRTSNVLKEEGSNSTVSRKSKLIMGALIGLETAGVCVVLFGAMSISDTVRRIIGIDPGFTVANRFYIKADLIQPLFPSSQDVKVGFDRTYQLLKESYLLEGAAYSASLPFVGGVSRSDFEIAGQTDVDTKPTAKIYPVSENYFDVMGIKILAGRGFELTDFAEPVAVVDIKTARRDFGSEDPLGKSIRFRDGNWMRIVGVVDAVKHFSLNNPMSAGSIYTFDPKTVPGRSTLFVVKLNEGKSRGEINAEVFGIFSKINPYFRPSQMGTLESSVKRSITAHLILSKVMIVVSIGALVIALLGIYGSIRFLATARIREIAIRIAFGCRRFAVVTLVGRAVIYPVIAGIILGGGGCIFLNKTLAASLGQGVASSGLLWFGTIVAVILLPVTTICLRTIWRLLSVQTYRLLSGT